ncbi:MAG: rhomboid family intramembrane serine protease [Xanthomonadaceae bacterium]|nr:rhomboid family intramembrane serine protease [Xanthomonadaceae bacterium]
MFSRLPPVTRTLLIINIVVFVLQWLAASSGSLVFSGFMLWPPEPSSVAGSVHGPGFHIWQLLTYGFLHGSATHLLFNMLALYMFGGSLELTWGGKRFLNYYLVCIVGAGLCQAAVGWWSMSKGGQAYPTLGASGGVYGLLLAYGMLFPNQRIMLLFPPIPMKARTFVIVFGAVELVLGVTGMQSGVAHFAHLGGMLFGWLMIRYWRGQPPFGRKRPPGPRIVK